MATLQLYFLGPPRIERDGRIVDSDTRKATALLAYLALSGERPSRDFLAAFLWPDFDDSHAKAALRRTLSALKTAVGPTAIFANRENIGLELDAVWCDVIQFRQAIATNDLETAVALHRDDFLTGFTLRDSIPFDDWQLHQQEQLRQELVQALAQLSHTTGGETAVAHARRWSQIDPLREEAHRQLMQLYAEIGQPNAALRQYRDCVRILEAELGVPPLPETTELYHAIQNGRLTIPPPPEPTPPPNLPAPLIGRATELAQMQAIYQQVNPDSRLLIIEGEPGIGKTRLAETFLQWATDAGATTLKARCYEGETNLAYAPLIHALQDGLTPAAAPRLQNLPAYHLAEASRLLPHLTPDRAAPEPAALNSPGAQVRFYEGLIHLLTALLDGPAPGVLWLDDVHWLDAASQEFLLYLLHRWPKRPFLILLCWRAEEFPSAHPLPPLAATLRHAGVCLALRPRRFTAVQVAELLAASTLTASADLPQRLFAETEGLPFFVVEYLHALTSGDASLTDDAALAIPLSVRDLLHNRLARIGEAERQIVQTAAAIGHSFDLALVQAGSGRSAEETVTALERLTRRGLLLEQSAVYDFSHDKLRALVYEEMGLARRRLLHRRLADALSHQRPATMALSAQIAAHYQLAGLEDAAAAHFVQAGDQARALFAHQDAIHYYRSALALGAADGWRLHAACGELSMRLGAYAAALAAYETALALAPAAELSGLEQQLAQVYQRQGEWALAAVTLEQAQARLGDAPDALQLAQLTIDRSLAAHRLKEPQAAQALAEQARQLAEQVGEGALLALAYNLLGMLARHRGELATAVALLTQSCELADRMGQYEMQIAARNNLALALAASGEPARAQTHLAEALHLCARYGDRHYEAALRSNLGDVLHQLGAEAEAQEQIRQSVAILVEMEREQGSWRAEIWQLVEW